MNGSEEVGKGSATGRLDIRGRAQNSVNNTQDVAPGVAGSAGQSADVGKNVEAGQNAGQSAPVQAIQTAQSAQQSAQISENQGNATEANGAQNSQAGQANLTNQEPMLIERYPHVAAQPFVNAKNLMRPNVQPTQKPVQQISPAQNTQNLPRAKKKWAWWVILLVVLGGVVVIFAVFVLTDNITHGFGKGEPILGIFSKESKTNDPNGEWTEETDEIVSDDDTSAPSILDDNSQDNQIINESTGTVTSAKEFYIAIGQNINREDSVENIRNQIISKGDEYIIGQTSNTIVNMVRLAQLNLAFENFDIDYSVELLKSIDPQLLGMNDQILYYYLSCSTYGLFDHTEGAPYCEEYVKLSYDGS